MLKELQIFLKFANFYKHFIKFYTRIIRALTKLIINSKSEKQMKFFDFNAKAQDTFQRLIKTFIETFMFVYFNSKNFIQIKIDASKFIIAAILFQLINEI